MGQQIGPPASLKSVQKVIQGVYFWQVYTLWPALTRYPDMWLSLTCCGTYSLVCSLNHPHLMLYNSPIMVTVPLQITQGRADPLRVEPLHVFIWRDTFLIHVSFLQCDLILRCLAPTWPFRVLCLSNMLTIGGRGIRICCVPYQLWA